MRSCPEMIAETIARLPEKTALVFGAQSLTYAELENAARGVALALRSKGVTCGEGRIVPIILPRSPDVPAAVLGVWKAGAAPCVISADYPAERIDYICGECSASLRVDAAFMEEARAAASSSLLPPDFESHIPGPEEPGLVVFTSGSTGKPKGVPLPHRALSITARHNAGVLREDDRCMSLAAFSFVVIVLDVFAPLCAGATVHILDDATRKDVALVAAYAKERGITAGLIPPQMMGAFLEKAGGLLRYATVGTERVRNIHSAETDIFNTYGCSETCGPVTFFPIDKLYVNTPIGKPVEGCRVYLLDEGCRPVSEGSEGEICVSGAVALGYLNSPELTAERFVSNPFAEGEHDAVLFRTNDLGRMLPDGNIEYVQRKDWMLKVRGFRVEPGEVEAAMLRAAPLEKAVVTGFENRHGQTLLHACYTAREKIDPAVVKRGMAEFLPDYMMPAFIEQLDSLPLNANGKVDRGRLAPPDIERWRADYAPPRNEAEKALCEAFAEVLGLERVGLDDDFIMLGGDSMAAVKLQSGMPGLSAADIFSRRTPRALSSLADNAAGRAGEADGGRMPRISRAAPREDWPLTFAERQMVVEQGLEPQSVAYNVNLAFSLSGKLDEERLERALAALVNGNRVLRSYYLLKSGYFVRRLAPVPPAIMEKRACALGEIDALAAELNKPFDLAKAPLFRFTLFKTGETEHLLHLSFHHAIIDGFSATLLLDELWKLYAGGERAGAAASHAESAPDYLDYAVWRSENEDFSEAEAYFMQMFADGVPENEMPTLPPRPERLPVADSFARICLPFAPLKVLARELGVTPYALLVAAIAMTAGKYCDSDDITLGAAMNGRVQPETGIMAGMFVNTLPVRLKPRGGLSLHEFIRETAAVLGEVQARQDCPLERLVPLLAPERTPARYPIFDVIVNYLEELPMPPMEDPVVRRHPLRGQALAVDLDVEMIRQGGELSLELSWSRLLYDEAVARNMLEQMGVILERMGEGADMPLIDAAELPERQRRQLLEEFAGERRDAWPGRTVVDVFRAMAAQKPRNRAVGFAGDELSYAELDAVTDNAARLLAAKGVGRGKTVGIMVKRGFMMPVGALGALKAGAGYVPLDPSYPAERLEYMLEDSGAVLLIMDEELADCAPGYGGEVLPSGEIMAMRGALAPQQLPPPPLADDLLVMLYTSGTTGKPKGVLLSHGNLSNFCVWYADFFKLVETDVVAAYASFGFDASLMDMFPALTHGASIQIIPDEIRLDLPALNACFNENGVSLSFMTTQLGRQFAETMDNRSLRALSVGGETLVPFEPSRDYAFYNGYGPTECAILSTAFRVNRMHNRVPLGKPLYNTNIYIVDRHGRLAPVGAYGELRIAGRQVALGYKGRPDLTAEKFVANPFHSHPDYARVYSSGDVARLLPDGNVDFAGRKDFQVKIRGFRVELTEIEGRIRLYPPVADAAVVPLDAPGGGKCAVAYVAPKTAGDKIKVEDLNAFIEEQLPPYMVPAAVVQLERIPLNANGKVDRKKLPAPDFGAARGGEEAESGVPRRPPNELERAVLEEARAVLGHDQCGVATNLLRAGLTSLSAIKLAARLDDRLGVAPAVRDMMSRPTAAEISEAILKVLLRERAEKALEKAAEAGRGREPGGEDGEAGHESPGEAPGRALAGRARQTGVFPISYSQAGICIDCLKRPGGMAYNVPVRLNLPPDVDAPRLATAVAAVIGFHPGIRARLSIEGERVTQRQNDAPIHIPCDFMDDAGLEAASAAFVAPFNLFDGDLWRARVIASPSAVVLLFDAHHIVFDGGSMGLLMRDLADAYELGGIPEKNREKISAYEWALMEEELEESAAWNEDKAWFAALLADFEAASEIPPDLPPKDGDMAEALQYVDGAAVEGFCREHGLTPAGLMLAAVSCAAARWTNSDEAWMAALSGGRQDVRLRNTMGMFVRAVPVRVAFGAGLTALEYARAARETLLGATTREGYPFARIAEEYGFEPSIMYACELGVGGEPRIGGHAAEMVPLAVSETKFKLSVHVEERGGRLVFAAQYDSGRYSRRLMEIFAETLGVALANIIASPQAPARSISLLSPEREKLYAAFNRPYEPVAEGVLHRMFEDAARRFPQRKALVAAEGEYDYSGLNAEANRLAHALLAWGAGPEDRVAFILRRTGRVLVAMLGVMKAGCAYIPVDPEYPAERIAHVLADSGARLVLTTSDDFELMEKIAEAAHLAQAMRPQGEHAVERGRGALEAAEIADIDAFRRGRETNNPNLDVKPENLAYLIYTSGSTGKPKGVMIEHRGIANYVTAHPRNPHVAALAEEAKAMLSVTTVAFDMFLKESFTTLCAGLTLVLADDVESRDPLRMAELFARTGADAFNATPSRLLEYAASPDLLRALRNCKVLMAGAEKYPEALLARLREGGGASARLFNTYGPTEITVSCNCKELTGAERVTVGAPLLNVHEYVVDADGNLLPCLVAGELLVGGAGVARGYMNLPEQTAERFVLYNGERVYKTGDLARKTEEGEIILLGRNDNQVKLRGLRIELGEIEKELLAMPGVRTCSVGIRNLGGADHLCAWYVADDGVTPEAARERLGKSLPQYMLPTAWQRLDAMPKLPNGKDDPRALPNPEIMRLAGYEAPANDLERDLCAIFASVLGIERVGALDSFFDLGGSSLAVTRIVIEAGQRGISAAEGLPLAFGDVFAHPTPRALATFMGREIAPDQAGEQCGESAASGGGGTRPKEKPGGRGGASVRQGGLGEQDGQEDEAYAPIHALLAEGNIESFGKGGNRPLGDVLLTGASGFLGAHVLHELLKSENGRVCCLLRPGRRLGARERLKQILYYYFDDTFEHLMQERLFIVEGDITDLFADAARRAVTAFAPNTIINCAANVSHFAVGSAISDVNLGGVLNLLELFKTMNVRLVQISTASVAGLSVDGLPAPHSRLFEQNLYIGQNLENQYIKSKFQAEKAMLEAALEGLDVKIMRVGNLMARSHDGEFQSNLNSNSFTGRLRAYNVLQCFPYSSFWSRVELAPVDSTAKAVCMLAEASEKCRVFHPFNNYDIYLGDIIMTMRGMGMDIELVEDDVFRNAVDKALEDGGNAEKLISLLAYQGMGGGKIATSLSADCEFTAQALLRRNWQWPRTDENYLRNFIGMLAGLDFFR